MTISLALAKEVEQRIVVDELLPLLVMLAEDSVASVRLALSQFLTEVLQLDPTYLSLPDISAAINILKATDDAVIRSLLQSAEDSATLAMRMDTLGDGVTSAQQVQFSPTGL